MARRSMRIGTVELRVTKRCERCVMLGHSQDRLGPRPTVLKTIGRINGACAGVYARVTTPGNLGQGDTVQLV